MRYKLIISLIMGRPKIYIVSLPDEDYQRIKCIAKSKDTSKIIRQRCNILLDVDTAHGKSFTYKQCINANGTCIMTVYKVVRDYLTKGLDAVLTIGRSPKSDTARLKVDGRSEAQLVALACSEVPEGHYRWTLELLEEKSRVILDQPVSRSTICRVLKKTNFGRTSMITGASPKRKMRNL